MKSRAYKAPLRSTLCARAVPIAGSTIGIVELDEPRRTADESERKRYYRLTRAGRAVLSAETERMAGLVRVARGRHRDTGTSS